MRQKADGHRSHAESLLKFPLCFRLISTVTGVEDGELIAKHSDATPNPVAEVRESLPDGAEFKAVWSHLRQSGVAKLVTVHFFDRG